MGAIYVEASNSMGWSGGVLRSNEGKWIAGFSNFDGHGDAFLAELMP